MILEYPQRTSPASPFLRQLLVGLLDVLRVCLPRYAYNLVRVSNPRRNTHQEQEKQHTNQRPAPHGDSSAQHAHSLYQHYLPPAMCVSGCYLVAWWRVGG